VRRVVVTVAAVMVAVLLTAGCAAPRNTLGTSASACFRALPTARTAVHDRGRFLGVRRVSRSRFVKIFHADPPPGREFCVVGFAGPYKPGEVDRAAPDAAGRYALLVVTMRGTTLLRTFVVDRSPLRFGHR
jgi:hypothetical protein